MNTDKPSILYVDDEPLNLELFEIAFEDIFNVHVCLSGAEGLILLETNKDIQLVLSDMRMPEMNGAEFITRAHALYPNMNYLMLSGFDQNIECSNLLAKGILKDYIVKPIIKDIFLNIVNSYLKTQA